jgi:hypothetical protein
MATRTREVVHLAVVTKTKAYVVDVLHNNITLGYEAGLVLDS